MADDWDVEEIERQSMAGEWHHAYLVSDRTVRRLKELGFSQSNETLRALWGRFCEIQSANDLIPSKGSVDRFKCWLGTWDDEEAWS